MASSDVSSSKHPGPTRTKIIEENIYTKRKLVEEKPNSSNFLPELVNTVERYVCIMYIYVLHTYLYEVAVLSYAGEHEPAL